MLRKVSVSLLAATSMALLAAPAVSRADQIRITTRVVNGAPLDFSDPNSPTRLTLSPMTMSIFELPVEEGIFDLPIFEVGGALTDGGGLQAITSPDLEIVVTDPDSGESGTFEIGDSVFGTVRDVSPPGVLFPDIALAHNGRLRGSATSFTLNERIYTLEFMFNRPIISTTLTRRPTITSPPFSGAVNLRIGVAVIPEPPAMALAAVGGVGVASTLALALARRRRRAAA